MSYQGYVQKSAYLLRLISLSPTLDAPHVIDRLDQVVIIARRAEEVIGCGVRDEMTGSEWSQIGGLENP
jgi:hypothetical protein